MVRVSKDPGERKQELIAAAISLFSTKGYDKTSISDIVRLINVAQGTFYYHFKSKLDILESAIHSVLAMLVDELDHLTAREDIDAVAKINQFHEIVIRFVKDNRELIAFIHDDSNLMMHDRMTRITLSKMIPYLKKIIEQGNEERLFAVAHPQETAHFILLALTEISHDWSQTENSERHMRAKQTFEISVAQILGMGEGEYRLNFWPA